MNDTTINDVRSVIHVFFLYVFIIHVAPCLIMKITGPVLYHLETKGTKCFGCFTFSNDGHFAAVSLLRLLQLDIVISLT